MSSFRLCGVPMQNGEEVLARIWLTLEAHGLPTPQLAVDRPSERLVDIRIRFHHAADAALVLDAIEPLLVCLGIAIVTEPGQRVRRDRPNRLSRSGMGDGAAASAEMLEQAHRHRLKAEEYRAVRDQMRQPAARSSYQRLADAYEAMARQLEEIAEAGRRYGSEVG